MELLTFADVSLPTDADDEVVWQLCQDRGYVLITSNRSAKDGSISLEMSIRRLLTSTSLPVVTIGNANRILADRTYCDRCAVRLAEIVFDLEDYLGVMRLFLS